MNFKFIFSIVFVFSQIYLFAHNPYQSSLKLSIYEQSGILEINLAQYGVEQALLKTNSNLDLKSIEANEYKELIINYLKENINLTINEQELAIGKGVIKLGSHQTDLKFEIKNIPSNPQDVNVYIPCFQENEGHENFFRVTYKKLTTRKKLNEKNNFSANFKITESEILVGGKIEKPQYNNFIFPVLFLSAICMFFLFQYQRKHKFSLT